MRYPFSGILVRYLQPSGNTCCSAQVVNEREPVLQAAAPDSQVQARPQANDNPPPSPPEGKTELCEIALPDELHVNLWEIGKYPANPFMDIGVMIGNRSEVGAVVIDLPWSVALKDVSDLGARLNGEKSVAAIFNEVVHYDGFAEGNFANISFRKNGKDEKPFSLLRLNSQLFEVNEMYLSDGKAASRLTIKIPAQITTVAKEHKRKSAYIRLRIRNIPAGVYTNVFSQKDRALISSNTETRIVDFRINVRRGIPEELLSGNETLDFPDFEKIHCFLTTERSEECISQSQNYSGYRSLMDEDVWNEYVRLDTAVGISVENSISNYLGYQWTAASKKLPDGNTKKVKDLIVLGRFSKVRSDIPSIARFVIVVIIIGAAGNGVWEFGNECLTGWDSACTDNALKLSSYIAIGVGIMSAGFLWDKFKSYLKKYFS